MTTPVEIMWLDDANKICSIICLVRLQQTQHQGLLNAPCSAFCQLDFKLLAFWYGISIFLVVFQI